MVSRAVGRGMWGRRSGRNLYWVLCGLLVACCGGGNANRPPDHPAFAQINKSVAALVDTDGDIHCAASWVSQSVLLTANHCVHGYSARLWHGKTYAAEVLKVDTRTDLALLRVRGVPKHGVLSIARRNPAYGERVWALGHPLGIPFIWTEGLASAVTVEEGKVEFLQASAQVMPGNSGGPLVNARGEIVGVADQLAQWPLAGLFPMPVSHLGYFVTWRHVRALMTGVVR